MNRVLFLLCCTPLFVGCASKYALPKNVETAKIRFVADVQTNIFTADDSGCSETVYQIDSINNGFESSSTVHKRLNMPKIGIEGLSPNKYTEVEIPASKPFVVYFRQLHSGMFFSSLCHSSFTFTPKADFLYQAKSIANGKECEASIHKLEKNGLDSYALKLEETKEKHVKPCEF